MIRYSPNTLSGRGTQVFFRLFMALALLPALVGCKSTQTATDAPKTSFSAKEQAMIMEGDTKTPMRVWLTTRHSDSLLLREKSRPVTVNPDDKVLQHFVQRLYSTVRDSASMGVGIAAPQVGILQQIIWVQRFDKEGFPFEVYLNPRIRQYTKYTKPGPEGCLSIPDERGTVKRAYAILIEYDKMDGSHEIEMVEDFTAVIFQHEIDHLYGVLYTDKLAPEEDAEGGK